MKKICLFLFTLFTVLCSSCSQLTKDFASDGIITVSANFDIQGAVPAELLSSNNVSRAAYPVFPTGSAYYYSFTVKNNTKNTTVTATSEDSTAVDGVRINTVVKQLEFPMVANDSYTLTLSYRKKITDGEDEVVMFCQHQNVSISSSNPVFGKSFILQPLTKGTGSVDLQIKYPGNSSTDDRWNITVTSLSDSTVTQKFCLSTYSSNIAHLYSGENTSKASQIPSGTYMLELELQKKINSTYCRIFFYKDVINVFDNLCTAVWLANGNDVIETSGSDSYLNLSSAVLANFEKNNVYVNSTVQSSEETGTFVNPYTSMQSALNYVMAIAKDQASYSITLLSDITASTSDKQTTLKTASNQSLSSTFLSFDTGSKNVNLDIIGYNSTKTIDANSIGRAFYISSNNGSTVTFKNIVIKNGNTQGSSTLLDGAGILTNNTSLVFQNSDVINNTISGIGKGAGICSSNADVTYKSGIVSGNKITGTDDTCNGGGIYFEGVKQLQIGDDSETQTALIGTDATYTGKNQAKNGGGIYIKGSNPTTNANLILCSNSIIGQQGKLTNSVNSSSCANYASANGGGIYSTNTVVTAYASTVCYNYAAGDSNTSGIFLNNKTINVKNEFLVGSNNYIYLNKDGSQYLSTVTVPETDLGLRSGSDNIMATLYPCNIETLDTPVITDTSAGVGIKNNYLKFKIKNDNNSGYDVASDGKIYMTVYVKGSGGSSLLGTATSTGDGTREHPVSSFSSALNMKRRRIVISGTVIIHIENSINRDSFPNGLTIEGFDESAVLERSASNGTISVWANTDFNDLKFEGGGITSSDPFIDINNGRDCTLTNCKFNNFILSSSSQIAVIRSSGSLLWVDSCEFGVAGDSYSIENKKNGAGAILCTKGRIIISNSTFTKCSAGTGSGGAISLADASGATCYGSISNCTFTDCNAGLGGGFYTNTTGNILFSNNTFSGCTGNLGAAIYNLSENVIYNNLTVKDSPSSVKECVRTTTNMKVAGTVNIDKNLFLISGVHLIGKTSYNSVDYKISSVSFNIKLQVYPAKNDASVMPIFSDYGLSDTDYLSIEPDTTTGINWIANKRGAIVYLKADTITINGQTATVYAWTDSNYPSKVYYKVLSQTAAQATTLKSTPTFLGQTRWTMPTYNQGSDDAYIFSLTSGCDYFWLWDNPVVYYYRHDSSGGTQWRDESGTHSFVVYRDMW